MDAQFPSVNVEMNGQAAQLLIKLMADPKTDQPMAVLTRALGMLEQWLAARQRGQRLARRESLALVSPRTDRGPSSGLRPPSPRGRRPWRIHSTVEREGPLPLGEGGRRPGEGLPPPAVPTPQNKK